MKLLVHKFWKSVCMWQSYGRKFSVLFCRFTVYIEQIKVQHDCKSDQAILWRYANFEESELQNPWTNWQKFDVGDYVDDNSSRAKIQNDSPVGGIVVYAWSIALAWFC